MKVSGRSTFQIRPFVTICTCITHFNYFRHIFSEMTTTNYDYTGYFTIVLTEHSNNSQAIVNEILKDCWSLYIANANVLAPADDYETAILYTFYPFTSEHCEHVKPIIHDQFMNGTFLYKTPMFPNKLRNLFKCPLKMSTYQFAPFMDLTLQSNGSYYTDGIEGTMFRAMADRLNFTPIAVISALNSVRNITNIAPNSKPKLRRSLEMVKY